MLGDLFKEHMRRRRLKQAMVNQRRLVVLPGGNWDDVRQTAPIAQRAWDGSEPWREHEDPVVPPPVEPETPVEPSVEPPVEPDPQDYPIPMLRPLESYCNVLGKEEGQYTRCMLAPDHSYRNGSPSPHKGQVLVNKTWTVVPLVP